jgi:hypothetical protein
MFAYALAALSVTAALVPVNAQTPSQSPAPAQTTPQAPADARTPAPASAQAPATNDRKTGNESPPLAGANSFTQSQAAERIQKAGYTSVQNLKQDEKGVWRGDATKNGQSVKVALDFRGNVVQQ